MKIKNILAWAAALAALSFGLTACDGAEPVREGGGSNTGTSVVYRVSVDQTSITTSSVTLRVSCNGTENDTWYAFVTEDIDSPLATVVSAEVASLDNVATHLQSGSTTVTINGLSPRTTYRAVLTGLTSNGTVVGTPSSATFTTSRDPDDWQVNPNWSIVYTERGSWEADNGVTRYGDGALATVTAGSDGWYAASVSVAEFQSVYNNSVAQFANALVEDLNAEIEYYNQMGAGYAISDFIFTDTGQIGLIMTPMTNEPHYLFMIGIDPVGTYGEGSGLYCQSEAFNPDVEDPTAEYTAWLGTYTFSGVAPVMEQDSEGMYVYDLDASGNIQYTPCETTVIIAENIVNYDYTIFGWQNGVMDDLDIGIPAFIETDGTISLYSIMDLGMFQISGEVGTMQFSGMVDGLGIRDSYDFELPVAGVYVIATMSNTDGEITLTPGELQLQVSGTSVGTHNVVYAQYYFEVEDGSYFYPEYNSPRFTSELTITKTSDSATTASTKSTVISASAPRLATKAQITAVPYKTLSPLKTVYMVK